MYVSIKLELEAYIRWSVTQAEQLAQRWAAAHLHSSDKAGDLSQWLWYDKSTINIVVLVIIQTMVASVNWTR